MSLCLLFELLKILERINTQNDDLSENGSLTTDATSFFTESELRKYNEEKNMSTGRTQWVEMCFTSVALALMSMLRKVCKTHPSTLHFVPFAV